MVTRVETKLFGRRYPWDEWFGRGAVALVRGVDFNGRSDTFVQLVRRAAVARRLSLVVRQSAGGEVVSVTVVGRLGRNRRRGRRGKAGATA